MLADTASALHSEFPQEAQGHGEVASTKCC